MRPYVLLVETQGRILSELGPSNTNQLPWESLLVHDTEAALEILRLRRVAVVVVNCGSDLPSMEALFSQIKTFDPAIIRLALAAEKDQLCETPSSVQQILAAQCRKEDILGAIESALQVHEKLQANPNLASFISQLHHLPTPPALYFSLRDELESPNGSLKGIANLLAKDTALTARILRIANSGFYARPRRICELHEAVGLIGIDLVLGIVLAAHLFDRLPIPGLNLDDLWKHNFAVAKIAHHIAKSNHTDPSLLHAAHLAGLLHDLGALVLLANVPGHYQSLMRRAQGDEQSLVQLEREELGAGHPEIGAVVLTLWNLPEIVALAVGSHHDLNDQTFPQANPVSQAVFLAESLVTEFAQQSRNPQTTVVDTPLKQQWRIECEPLLAAALK